MSAGTLEDQGVFRVYFVSETAEVELRSERVKAPAWGRIRFGGSRMRRASTERTRTTCGAGRGGAWRGVRDDAVRSAGVASNVWPSAVSRGCGAKRCQALPSIAKLKAARGKQRYARPTSRMSPRTLHADRTVPLRANNTAAPTRKPHPHRRSEGRSHHIVQPSAKSPKTDPHDVGQQA